MAIDEVIVSVCRNENEELKKLQGKVQKSGDEAGKDAIQRARVAVKDIQVRAMQKLEETREEMEQADMAERQDNPANKKLWADVAQMMAQISQLKAEEKSWMKALAELDQREKSLADGAVAEDEMALLTDSVEAPAIASTVTQEIVPLVGEKIHKSVQDITLAADRIAQVLMEEGASSSDGMEEELEDDVHMEVGKVTHSEPLERTSNSPSDYGPRRTSEAPKQTEQPRQRSMHSLTQGVGARERAMRVLLLSQALCYKRIERGWQEGRIRDKWGVVKGRIKRMKKEMGERYEDRLKGLKEGKIEKKRFETLRDMQIEAAGDYERLVKDHMIKVMSSRPGVGWGKREELEGEMVGRMEGQWKTFGTQFDEMSNSFELAKLLAQELLQEQSANI